MLFYRAALPLSPRTLHLTARTICVHRRNTRSRWRRLDPGQQVLLVLVHLHKGETFAELAAGFRISLTTVWRYVRETTRLLAQQAPTLKQGLCRARRKGWGYVIVDGTLLACDRVGADRPFSSGRHQQHGMNIQVVAAPGGEPVWVSWSLLGSVHEATAALVWRIAENIRAAGLLGLGDKGCVGLNEVVFVPFKAVVSRSGRRRPTPSTPSFAVLESGPSLSSRTGASCVSFAATHSEQRRLLVPSCSFSYVKHEGNPQSYLFSEYLPEILTISLRTSLQFS